jgi:hypothetical protein
MKKDLIVKNTSIKKYDINDVNQLTEFAQTLKNHILKNKLYMPVQGKNYVQVEGWQFAGGLLGLIPRVVRLEDISREGEKRWLAEVEIVDRNDRVVSRGFAICSQKEMDRLGSDEYVLASMAQTRAIGKAYRNVIGWVVKLAGYEPTPTEEIQNVSGQTVLDKDQREKEVKMIQYEKLLMAVIRENDPKKLEAIKEKIEKSKVFNPEQKEQIINIINEKNDEKRN